MVKKYSVGYGKPPVETRFKKGQSGNPKGRSKGSKNLKKDLEEELKQTLPVREGGRTRQVTKQRALLKSLTAKGLQGDAKAANAVLNLVLRVIGADPADKNASALSQEDQEVLERYFAKFKSGGNT